LAWLPSRCRGLLNPPNRRIRTRTSGGVGGEESRDSPLSRSPLDSKRGHAISIVFGLPPRDALDRSGKLLVSLHLLGLALPVQDTGPLQMLPRGHQEGPGRFVDHHRGL
jgi:hypothetical protein